MIDISEQDAVRILKCLSDEHNIKINVNVCEWTNSIFLVGLTTTKEEYVHMCYAKNTLHPTWIEISVPMKEWELFHDQQHAYLLNLALDVAIIDDVAFYDGTGEHVLIKKGTTIEELLMKADLRVYDKV